MIQSHHKAALIGMVDERRGSRLDPQTLNECKQRLARDRPEHAMEVERRERRDTREGPE